MDNLYKININVDTLYIEPQSDPENNRYVFTYTINILNQGKVNVQLISRHWIVTDANQKTQEIKGLGVVGEQPVLQPNESFKYTSGTIIETPVGTMQGEYQMEAENGYKFEAEIPMFSLKVPKIVN
ncbi:MAG: Co2+/Mg2+ efflux protein ApaG [Gammaproteobacteria bacterium]|nr:Co2+/Mg2+ efflux protein ApaG [Gammaproteobacteria bacterium]|tara:strand:- start:1144 stop:1521 length:378 start_codon:yes stop_codon:yes gene_type:complete